MAPNTPSKDEEREAALRIRNYLAALPPDARKRVREMQKIIRAAAPDATEHFSYGIPGFRLNGKPMLWCAGWKKHTSLYPVSDAVKKAHAKDLAVYETSKGTVRFPLSSGLPTALLKRLVKARMAEMQKQSVRGS